MSDPRPPLAIAPGWDVYDVDDELVGLVIDVATGYIVIEPSKFDPTDVVLANDLIATADNGRVTLSVTGADALASGLLTGQPVGVGPFSTAAFAPAIMMGGQAEELGTSVDDPTAPATPPIFQPIEIAYLERLVVGRLATVSAAGEPHVVPVTYRYNWLLETIDISGPEFAASKKYQDVLATGRVAFVVDDLDANQVPRGIELRGRGELLATGGQTLDPQFSDDLLRVYPEHIAHWGLAGE